MKYPNKLAALRSERKLTQEEMIFTLKLNDIDLSLRHYARFEAGTHIPDLILARAIADALELEPDDIWEVDNA